MKTQNPVVGLFIALAVMVMVFMMMSQVLQPKLPKEEVQDPDPVRSFVAEETLAPFKDKFAKNEDRDIAPLVELLKSKSRDKLLGYLAVDIQPQHLSKAPRRYAGQWVPLTLEQPGKDLDLRDHELQWQSFPFGERTLRIGFINPHFNLDDRPMYLELLFLGSDGEELLGIAKEAWELPDKGLYPMAENDALALGEVVDEMADRRLHKMTREVSPIAMSHFFGKLQRGDHRDLPLKDVRYTELMETPDAFRASKIHFTGRLIFKQRKRLSAQGLPPGLDVYEEGFLLNASRIPFVFRTPSLNSDIEIDDIVRVEGYFLQRINYLNRMNRATWAPLILTLEPQKVKEQDFSLSTTESAVIGTFIAIFLGGFLLFALRKPQRTTIPRMKKGYRKAAKAHQD